VDLRQAGKRALESLIRVGALDRFGGRKAILNSLDRIISISSTYFREQLTGQMSFFGNVEGIHDEIALEGEGEVLDKREQLEWEKELIGLYVSDHPLAPYLSVLQTKVTHFSAQLNEAANKEKVTVAGMVAGIRTLMTKTNKMMAFLTLEDIQGTVDLVLFPKVWQRYGDKLEPGQVISATGSLDAVEGVDPKVLVDQVVIEELPDLSSLPKETPAGPPEPPDIPPPPPADSHGGNGNGRSKAVPAPNTSHKSKPAIPDWEEDIPPPPDGDDWYMDQPGNYHATMEVAPIFSLPSTRGIPSMDIPLAMDMSTPVIDQEVLVQASGNLAHSVPVEYILPPFQDVALPQAGEEPPKMITVTIESTGNKERDTRRLRHIHGILHSCPGKDRFSFLVQENGQSYMIQFPNDTTGFNLDIHNRLVEMVGAHNVRSEPICFG
jgi:DNA polymerase III subunit alpha